MTNDTYSVPKVDQYVTDQANSPHLSPKLIIEKSIIPNLTLWVGADGKEARLQRWYDVSVDTLNNVGVRSIDFVPDGLASLVDKDGNEIYRANIKITDEFDDLPLVLARIEKSWSLATSPMNFWNAACDILKSSDIPSFKELAPEIYGVTRIHLLEFACFWIAFLAKLRNNVGDATWEEFTFGDRLILRYVDFYNASSSRGPKLNQPPYTPDRFQIRTLLTLAREAATNVQKKNALESLAESLLAGISGFEVLPNKLTATGEIDRFVRNNSQFPTLVRLGSPILVECKYWQKRVGTDPLGAFIVDLQDARLKSGFLFSRDNISGPAMRRIHNFYQREQGFIIVVTEKEIQDICDGDNLVRMVVEKMESIMFQRAQS